MKTERRHELQTNDLADWLGQRAQVLRPYGMALLGGLVVVAAVLVSWTILRNQRDEAARETWDRYFLITSERYLTERLTAEQERLARETKQEVNLDSPAHSAARDGVVTSVMQEIEAFAEANANSVVGALAALRVADHNFSEASRLLFTRPSEASPKLDTAVNFYELAVNAARDPDLQARARLGLAKALESRRAADERDSSRDDLKVARENYARLKDSPLYADYAQQRVDVLAEEAGFYNWFAEMQKQSSSQNSIFNHGFGLGGAFDNPGEGSMIFNPHVDGPQFPAQPSGDSNP